MSHEDVTPFDLIRPEDIAQAKPPEAPPPASDEISPSMFAAPALAEAQPAAVVPTRIVAVEPPPALEADPEPGLKPVELFLNPQPRTLNPTATPPAASGWTLPILCLGLAILACCVLIPQSEDNRKLVYERERLKADLERVDRQIATNDQFLKKIAADPTLAERLAQRQMKMIREGTSVLELKGSGAQRDEMSPFMLVNVPAADPLPPFEPMGGVLGRTFASAHSRLYMMGLGLLLTASGLVLGAGAAPSRDA